jgi:ADP-dependent NAD(P)H-hydrate dehydratase
VSAVAVTPAVLRAHPLPDPDGGKHDRGQVLVVGGSGATPGAVRLAGEAALRGGAGKLTLATVDRHVPCLGTAVPESAVTGLDERDGNIDPGSAPLLRGQVQACDALLIGPGCMDPEPTVQLCEALLRHTESAVVLDALGTACLTEDPERLRKHPAPLVLNVNPDELSHLSGSAADSKDLMPDVLAVAERTGATVLCGGQQKLIAAPDGRCWRVEGGGPGLGVSGSGDVQAGLLAGMVARGGPPEVAALWAAHVHARAGERLSARIGRVGYLAREILEEIPQVLREVE